MEENVPQIKGYEKVDPEEIIKKLKKILSILNQRKLEGAKDE
jgi:hypothetical protein